MTAMPLLTPGAQRRIRGQRAGTTGDGNGYRHAMPSLPHRRWSYGRC